MRGLLLPLFCLALASSALGGEKSPPSKRTLAKIVPQYLKAKEPERARVRQEFADQIRPLYKREAKSLVRDMLHIARRKNKGLGKPGINYWYDEKTKRGKYIVKGRPAKTLFIGLHGGGAGSGDAGAMASAMGGGGFFWIFPEVLEKTERGWTDSGTEEFVLELVDAAKRTGRVDPNRVYVTGHSMGGYGTWTLLGHHPDIFAGGAAYAGAPTMYFKSRAGGETLENIQDVVEGVIPNLLNSRLLVFQSTDDPRVPPGPNQYAISKLSELHERYADGFDFRYVEVNDRGHAPPKEGYLPTQQWVAKRSRTARPRRLIWQPVLTWKHQFYWLFWGTPTPNSIVLAEAKENNQIEIRTIAGKPDYSTVSVLLGEPLIDLGNEVVVRVDGEERYRAIPELRFETLLLTLPRRDEELMFAARADIGSNNDP